MNRHIVEGAGLGDINLIGTIWLWDPRKHGDNIALGFGVKTPSGNNEVTDSFFQATGSPTQAPADQSIQLGDGGWGFILQAQAYRKIFGRTSGYLNSSYLLSPNEKTSTFVMCKVSWTQ